MDAAIDHARSRPGFAGAYLDQQALGRPVFLYTAITPTIMPTLARLLPADVDVQIELASRTEDDLLALQRRVESEELRAGMIPPWLEQTGTDMTRFRLAGVSLVGLVLVAACSGSGTPAPAAPATQRRPRVASPSGRRRRDSESSSRARTA
jgi:hypothetical protein